MKRDEELENQETEEFFLNVNGNGKGFAGFIYPDKVPAEVTYNLLGFAIIAARPGVLTTTLDGLRIWKANKSILEPAEAWAKPELFSYNNGAGNTPIFLLPKKVPFVTGEDMKVEIKATADELLAETIKVRFVAIVEQVPV